MSQGTEKRDDSKPRRGRRQKASVPPATDAAPADSAPDRRSARSKNLDIGETVEPVEEHPAVQTVPQNRRTEGQATSGSALEQAIALRDSLRVSAAAAGELVRALKKERKQSRALRTTLASLKSIENLDA